MKDMDKIAIIRQEIERRITDNTFGAKLELIDILAWLDTLSEEPDKSLEEAAEEKYPVYWKNYPKDGVVRSESAYDTNKQCRDAFIVGAEWQKKRFEAEYELDWLTDLKKDLYELGRKDEREQMLKEAVECVVCAGMEGDKWIMTYIGDYESIVKTCKAGDKVRIIIVREDEK